MEIIYRNKGTDEGIKRNTEMGERRAYGDDSPACRIVEVVMIVRTKIEKYLVGNAKVLRMLTVAATLFFAGAVFQITADKLPEGIIYFIAAVCFASLERACYRRADETKKHNEVTDCEEGDNE